MDPKSQLKHRQLSQPYAVGYRKPPESTRFQPGQSGNLSGRPKGCKSKRPALNEERLKEIIVDEAYRTIKVTEGKRQITIPMAQAVIRSVAVNAAKGHSRSQKLFAELLTETERANRALSDKLLETAIDYKNWWEDELARRTTLGLTGPEPLPHPDDVVIDTKRGQVVFKGPLTKEEKAEWDKLWARADECSREIDELTGSLKERKNKRYKRFIEDEIAHERQLREMIVGRLGEKPIR